MDEKWLWIIFAVVESWLEGGMNDGQDKDGYSADEGVFCRTDEGKADEEKKGQNFNLLVEHRERSFFGIILENFKEVICL